jgi:sortase A
MNGILRWFGRALIAGGALLLAYCGMVWLDARIFQERESRLLDSQLEAALHVPPAPVPLPVSTTVPLATKHRGVIGRLEIPRLGLSEIIVEGANGAALRRGIGHISSTPLPGQIGNAAITGHRDTFFRPLRNIERDDLIRITTPRGKYAYHVVSMSIVEPDNAAVLGSDGNEAITLITCYPFYFVGPAPKRMVVRAERIAPPAEE